MVQSNIEKFVVMNEETLVFSKTAQKEDALKIKYRIDKDEKSIRLYDVPKMLDFQDKSLIYYAILDSYYFFPADVGLNEYEGIEDYVVKENGYSYHEFNQIEGESKGILAELLYEIPRQLVEVEKLSRIRDIYEMLERNAEEVGIRPICISFNGILPDFKDVFKVVNYIFKTDEKLSKKADEVKIFKRNGFLAGNKRIFIVPRDLEKALAKLQENDE